MSNAEQSGDGQHAPGAGTGAEAERQTALFASLVLQQANMASMFLGRSPRPDGREQQQVDLGSASVFIDTLEMLEAKTQGRLTADESRVLREALTTLRIAFVQAADQAGSAASGPSAKTPEGAAAAEQGPASGLKGAAASPSAPGPAGEGAAEADARKKFVKRY